MKGSPLLRALVTFGVLLLFGIPVRWVMRSGGAESGTALGSGDGGREGVAEVAVGGARAAGERDRLEVESTAELKRIVIRCLGVEILRVEGGARRGEANLPVASGEGMDLSVELEWAGEGVAAVRFRRVPRDGAAPVDRYVWGAQGGRVEDVVTFPEG